MSDQSINVELYKNLISTVNNFRVLPPNAIDIQALLAALQRYSDIETVQIFRNICSNSTIDMLPMRNFIRSKNPNLIIGFFDIPYNLKIGLDVIVIEDIKLPKVINQNYPSMGQPVNLILHTDGFSDSRAVALFPENFATSTQPKKNDNVYYFINKFVNRFFLITLPVIKSKFISAGSFYHLKNSQFGNIEIFAAIWVRLHEFFHTQGTMSLPEYLPYKSSRTVAGLEELRVDIKSMVEVNESKVIAESIGKENTKCLAEFIFAERLLRYPIEKNPQDDYDARSSIIFLNMLLEKSAIKCNISKDHLYQIEIDANNLFPALREISNEIDNIEKLARSDLANAKKILWKFAKSKSIRVHKKYQSHPFYEQCREICVEI